MKATVIVYLKGGTKWEYDIESPTEELLGAKAREHMAAIMLYGYRNNTGKDEMTWWGPGWIDKIVVKGSIPTTYPDRISGT